LKILVLYQSPWWNAAAYYAYNLVKSFTRIGHEVIFVCKKGTPIAAKISNDNYKLIDINLFENNPIKFIGNINKVRQIILEENIDCLVPISAPGHIIVGAVKKFLGIKLPIVKICLDNMAPTNNFLNKYLHNELTDYFIFPGQSTKIKYNSFSINRFSILHAPLDLKMFLDYAPSVDLKLLYGVPADKIVISFIGRFSPEKGIFFLLEIIHTVLQKTDKTFFILSGSEEQIKHKTVQKKIDDLKITNSVKIINKVDDVRKIISITDIGLLSSRFSEYVCRIAMEFMSFKIPIVAPRVNVIPEVVGGIENGFIYEIDNFNQASDYINKLVNDSDLLSEMGNNSFNRIKNIYDTKVFDSNIGKIIKSLK
jgi:alpha-1,6-mannosyltransferase